MCVVSAVQIPYVCELVIELMCRGGITAVSLGVLPAIGLLSTLEGHGHGAHHIPWKMCPSPTRNVDT